MLTFKDITLEDKDRIIQYTIQSKRNTCDLSFSNLCSWRFLYHTLWAEKDGFMFLKFWIGENHLAYMPPIGEGDWIEAIKWLEEDAKSEGTTLYLSGVTPDLAAELEKRMPGRFAIRYNREYADYIYLRTDLATLSGKKFQPKRNHINRFKKSYNYEYVPVTPDNIIECIKMEAEWCRVNNCNDEDGTTSERRAIIFALTHFEELGLSGGMLRVDGKIVAFTLGMPITEDTFGIHVEKADTNVDGAYTMINYEFANHIPEQYVYLNREEDLGIEGLRKAKLSYQPTMLLEKGIAILNSEL